MFPCPNCQSRLIRGKAQRDLVWTCPSCASRAISSSVLQKHIVKETVDELWSAAPEGEPGRGCPVCRHPMAIVHLPVEEKAVVLDVCRPCKLVWFDPAEYGQMPTVAARRRDRKSERSYRAGLRKTISQTHQRRSKSERSQRVLDSSWKWIPVFLGMPVETESASLRDRPLLTWGLSVTLCAISLSGFFGLFNLEAAVQVFALIPAEFWRYGGVTFLTSFFLHADFFHLLGNVYFMMVFGDNVEDYLGIGLYWKLLLLATLAGDVLHILSSPASDTPSIGASGGISGVIAFYALRFPKARIGISLLRLYVIPVSALFAFILWIILQIIGSWEQIVGLSNVSSLAHLGGALIGVYFWYREKDI